MPVEQLARGRYRRSFVRATASLPTARSSRASPRSTRRRSPASRCRSPKGVGDQGLCRQHQCQRHAARPDHAHGRRQHDRAHHSPGRGSARIEGADRAFHRPVLGLLHAGRHGGGSPDHRRAAARRRRRLVHLDLSRPGDAAHRLPLRAGDLDTGGNRVGARIRRAPRASHQGRSSPGNARQGPHRRLRQDRHAHGWKAAGDRRRRDRRHRRTTCLAKAAAVERGSSHPLGLAIIAAAEARKSRHPAGLRRQRRQFPARQSRRGCAKASSRSARPAMRPNSAHCRTMWPPASRRWRPKARPSSSFSLGKRVIGLIALRDEPREDAAAGIARLQGARHPHA